MSSQAKSYALHRERFLDDSNAANIASQIWGLPESLHIPIAAFDEATIAEQVGDIVFKFQRSGRVVGFLVNVKEARRASRNAPVWNSTKAELLNPPLQVWINESCADLRAVFIEAFPRQEMAGLVVAKVLSAADQAKTRTGIVRVCAISRRALSANRLAQVRAAKSEQSQYTKGNRAFMERSIRYAHSIELAILMDIPVSTSAGDGFISLGGDSAMIYPSALFVASNVRRA